MQVVPITYAQQFIYRVQDLLGPRAAGLQLAVAVRVSGPIDAARFERAADGLLALHPILGARLDRVDGELVQRRSEWPARQAPFEVMEVPGGTASQIDTIFSSRADEPLDLLRGGPVRMVLAITAPDQAYLLLVCHRIFVDGIGIELALRDYLRCYLKQRVEVGAGQDYFDFAMAESRMILDGSYAKLASYWADKLSHGDPRLHLPGRPADPVLQSPRLLPFTVDRESFAALSARARKLRVTPFGLITSAIFTTLREFTSQDQLMLTVVTDTRRKPFTDTIGSFAGFFMLRQFARDAGMDDAAVRLVFQDILAARRHSVPFEHFSDQLGWLQRRFDMGYSMSDVYVNFLPRIAVADSVAEPGENDFSAMTLTQRVPGTVSYHGMDLMFTIMPDPDLGSLSGTLLHETAIASAELAGAINATWIGALAG